MAVFLRIIAGISLLFIVPVLSGCAKQSPAEVIVHNSTLYQHKYQKDSQVNPFAIQIKQSDTLYNLAKKHGTNIRDLIDLNGLRPPYKLAVGRTLRLPKATFHIVKQGDTLYSISRTYQVDISRLIRANNLQKPYILRTNNKLRLPAPATIDETLHEQFAEDEAPKSPIIALNNNDIMRASRDMRSPSNTIKQSSLKPLRLEGVPAPILKSEAQKSGLPTPIFKPGRKYASKTLRKTSTSSGKKIDFHWPVNGRVISRFGPKKGGLHNDGINIAAEEGASIKAAAAGNVVYAGNELRGYGNLLLIRHDNGFLTAYAHTQKNMVKKGQRVTKGQTIATIGNTGHVSSPQLHFSIRKGRKAVDPERYLSKKFSSLN